MRYTIIINQLALQRISPDVTLEEAVLLDYLYWLCTSPSAEVRKMRIWHDGREYTWFGYKFYLQETPILGERTSATITPKMKKLEERGFIKTILKKGKHGGDKKYVCLLNKTDALFRDYGRKIVKKEKAISPYGRQDINEVIEFLREKLGGSPDGSIKENRRWATLVLGRMKKDYPDEDPVKLIKLLISAGMQDDFHSKTLTNFKYLYYNLQKIIQSTKNKGRNKKFVNLDV